MTDEQAPYTCLQGDGGSLGGGAMETLPCLGLEVFQIGGLMIEQIDATDISGYPLVKHCVCGVGIRFGFVGGLCHPLILDEGAILFEIAFPPFQPIEKRRRNVMLTCFFGVDPAKRTDFAEDKTPAFDTMDHRKTADLEFLPRGGGRPVVRGN